MKKYEKNILCYYYFNFNFNISDDYRFSDNAKCQPNYTVSHMEKDKLQYEAYIYDFLLKKKIIYQYMPIFLKFIYLLKTVETTAF